jgi:hypothetical protein
LLVFRLEMLNLKSLTVAGPDPAIQPPRVGAAK